MARGEQDRPVPWRERVICFALLPLTWAIQSGARTHPDGVERIYSQTIYPFIREFIGTLTGWMHYSFAEILIYLTILLVLYRVYRAVQGLARRVRSPRNVAAHTVSWTLGFIGLAYCIGMVLWAFNYHRQPFLYTENLDRVGISAPELQEVCLDLAAEANKLRAPLPEDDQGVLRLPESKREALQRAKRAFDVAEQPYASLQDGFVSNPKGLLLPILPNFHVAGFFFPYTHEPNVAIEQPVHSLLFSSCHEMAHQLSWAREEEANFVGYAVCRYHPDDDYRYAVTQGALRYALWTLEAMDRERAVGVRTLLEPGILRDWEASKNFWSEYDGRIADSAQKVNDAYLKSNGQEEGVRSYGLMVDLLVADYRRRSE